MVKRPSSFIFYPRTCSRLIFLGKNEINRQLFKEKTQVNRDSIKQVFDAEKQDLAIFGKKAMIFNQIFYKYTKA